MHTLPDYLVPGLDIVFVGINPGAYSAQAGHYFATPQNRFWHALNRSGLVNTGRDLGPEDDNRMTKYGIGFTDVVKRPSNSASNLRAEDYRRWAPVLNRKLAECGPLIACFHGVTGYRNYLLHGEGVKEAPQLGPQERTIGASRVYLVPNPSPANAVFSLDTLVKWYRRLGAYRDQLKANAG
jgi:TDG/mug DNA glycosylase family protein